MQFHEEALKYLNLGIESELAAYVFYRRAAHLVEEHSLQDLINKLALDEKNHFLALEDEFDKNVRSECWAPYKDIMNKEGLPDIDELVQETHKELLARIRGLKTKKDVLLMALSLEKEALDLYSAASSRIPEPGIRKVFEYLSAFEKGHVQIIERELSALV
jgi:rubrerythrin